jgi:hypothetical protein
MIVDAARTGRVSAASARRWARRAAAGEDISILPLLTPGGPGLGAVELTRLASDVAEILGSAAAGARGRVSAADDAITDAEADQLFPARSLEEAEERWQTVEAAAARVADYTTEELHAELFGGSAFEDTHSAGAAAAPGHVEYRGQHVHEHSDYQRGRHVHAHTHAGDASHAPGPGHEHP